MIVEVLQKHVRIRLATISSRSSYFLEITFHRSRNIIVNNGLYVGFIDTHSKGNRCNEDVYLFDHKVGLDFKSPFLGEIRGVILGFEAVLLEEKSDIFGC